MGSSHVGELGLGSQRSGSSKRGKKGSLDRPKQPQRGLGVAQLEMIRLKNQMGCGYLQPLLQGPFHSNLCKVVFEDLERREIIYGDPQSGVTTSTCESLNFAERTVTLPLLRQPLEDWVKKRQRRRDRCGLMGSSSQASFSGAGQELDLDLKLSL